MLLLVPEVMISSLSSLHIIFTSLRNVLSTTTSQERLTESPWDHITGVRCEVGIYYITLPV